MLHVQRFLRKVDIALHGFKALGLCDYYIVPHRFWHDGVLWDVRHSGFKSTLREVLVELVGILQQILTALCVFL